MKLGRPESLSGCCGEEKNSWPVMNCMPVFQPVAIQYTGLSQPICISHAVEIASLNKERINIY
jgi:hypothetical protein